MNRPKTLAPSKSTVYVSNLPFSLTNSDLHKIFAKYGDIVRVTILRDNVTRNSKGVAFILFKTREEATACVRGTENHQMFGRTLRSNIAKDNGRAPEFIRRREYPDKSRCYECGEEGHLSFKCPKNLLGDRDVIKKRKKKKIDVQKKEHVSEECEEEEEEEEDYFDESLSAAIKYEQSLHDTYGNTSAEESTSNKKKRIKRSAYFSDEEEEED
ncbi:zinc finger CCHC-type and RNA-binding motif-containing protein 1-like [Oratosquilla oratoria]|uniref:zinc finger CCHC-type and RNA-binding motif-containing protein 1-like n=1 Tax=Oratosquilla oratoria TaxID=337810 RepID=UPI003F75E076